MRLSNLLAAKGAFVATVEPAATVGQAVSALSEHGVGALVVSADGRTVAGILSERDVVRALRDQGPALLDQAVETIMTVEVHAVAPSASTEELMAVMTERRIRHVPVLDEDGAMLGIISIGDVVKVRLGELEGDRQALIDYVSTAR